MRNADLQKQLDERKWIESRENGRDMAGDMPYCEKCENRYRMMYSDKCLCKIFHEERVKTCACAKAYRKKK